MAKNENKTNPIRELLKNLSNNDLRDVGLDQIAYIRPIDKESRTIEAEPYDLGGTLYGVYAADGECITEIDSFDGAIAAIIKHDLQPVTLH